jgi:hypothetical protein
MTFYIYKNTEPAGEWARRIEFTKQIIPELELHVYRLSQSGRIDPCETISKEKQNVNYPTVIYPELKSVKCQLTL